MLSMSRQNAFLFNFLIFWNAVVAQNVEYATPHGVVFSSFDSAALQQSPCQELDIAQYTNQQTCGSPTNPCFAAWNHFDPNFCSCIFTINVSFPHADGAFREIREIHIRPILPYTRDTEFKFRTATGSASNTATETFIVDLIFLNFKGRFDQVRICPCGASTDASCFGPEPTLGSEPWIHFKPSTESCDEFLEPYVDTCADGNFCTDCLTSAESFPVIGSPGCYTSLTALSTWGLYADVTAHNACPMNLRVLDEISFYDDCEDASAECDDEMGCPMVMFGLPDSSCGECKILTVNIPTCPEGPPLCGTVATRLKTRFVGGWNSIGYAIAKESFLRAVQEVCLTTCNGENIVWCAPRNTDCEAPVESADNFSIENFNLSNISLTLADCFCI